MCKGTEQLQQSNEIKCICYMNLQSDKFNLCISR
jgi:hypothetical protein